MRNEEDLKRRFHSTVARTLVALRCNLNSSAFSCSDNEINRDDSQNAILFAEKDCLHGGLSFVSLIKHMFAQKFPPVSNDSW